jgi:hypothetical protein
MAQVITWDVFPVTRKFNGKSVKRAFVRTRKRTFHQLPRL